MNRPTFELTRADRGELAVLTVAGDIDVDTAWRLREELTTALAERDAVVEMSAVDFLDSTGLGVLVGGLKRVRSNGGSLDVVCTHDRLLKIFRITGLTKVFGIHDSVASAIASH